MVVILSTILEENINISQKNGKKAKMSFKRDKYNVLYVDSQSRRPERRLVQKLSETLDYDEHQPTVQCRCRKAKGNTV